MHVYLAIAVGSAAGGVSRLLIGTLLGRLVLSPFPYGTLLVNLSGSFLLGFALAYAEESGIAMTTVPGLLLLAFCGSFTTVSTFTLESLTLGRHGHAGLAIWYVLLSIAGCVAAAAAGALMGQGVFAWLD